MTEQQKFRVTITTRYTIVEKDTYEKVMELVRRTSIPKSKMQLILVKNGLKHLNGPTI